MTINNKSERNDWGNCLGWPVTSYGPGYGVSSWHWIILCRKETNSFVYTSANKVKIYLTALILFSHVFWTVQYENKPKLSHVNSYLATKNFNISFSLTFVIFPLGQCYNSLRSLTGFQLHWDYLPESKVSFQGEM